MQHIIHKTFSPDLLKLPLAKYGGRQTVTALPGDGIGPEMINHVQNIFEIAQVPIDFETIKLDSQQTSDNNDLQNAIISIERNGVGIKGNIETKFTDSSVVSRNVALRVQLDLFANVLRCVSLPNVKCKYQNLDVILVRENTEGEYSGIEHETVPGVVESLKIVTRRNIDRIARFAFELAVKYDRKKVTAVHKANIM
uniref:Isopropylmalate dehydrogenase-like domain-containing protein n=1 Tax=Romanomermis culicivorax TaxID=13658 RepID=A0A915JSD3_ROMCU